jgi:hypothetical protein
VSFAARFASPRRDELAELAKKYDTLADLRQRRDDGGGVAPRGELLALARAFPGALRELDTLPRAVIEERRGALRAALSGAPSAPWMTWMIAYHLTMRAALFVKRELARARMASDRRDSSALVADDVLVQRLADEAARHFDLPIDEDFVRAVARPPARRVNAAVFDRLGRELDVASDQMWQALFPARRAGRF